MPEALVGRYQFTREIGRGGFGLVEEYHDLILGTDVAIKTVAPHFIKQETKRLIREVDIMQFLYKSHPHVIDFESMFVTRCRGGVDSKVSMPALGSNRLNVLGSEYTDLDTDEKLALHHQYLGESINEIRPDEAFSLHIVMPLMKGDLTSFIKLCASDSEQQRYSLTANYLGTTAAVFGFQLFLGLDYLHRCGIIHRDLKPENILVCLDQARALNSTLRIADLGLAREMQDSDTFYVCTRYYRAPEVVMTAIKGHPGLDMWSMGCILYEMCTNRTLFTVPSALDDNGAWEGVRASTQLEVILNVVGTPSRQDVDRYMPKGNAASYLRSSSPRPSRLVEYLRNYWILDCPESAKADWIDLITRCLHFFPQQRPTAEEAACHPLFQHHGIYLGRNVQQHPMRSYVPTFTDRDTANALTNENKGRILELVRIVMDNTRPLISDDDAGDHGGSEEENVEDEFTDDDEVIDEEEEEHQPSALAAPLVTIDDGYHMDETHYALDTDTMESSLSSSGSDFDTELFEGSTLRNEESTKKKSKEPSSNSRRQPATSPGKTANEEDEDDGIYGAGSSFARISNAAGNSVGRQKVSSNRRGNGRTRGSGKPNSSTNGNEEEDDDDTAMVPSAARFASAVNLGSTFQLTQTRNNTTQEGSDGCSGTLNNDSNGSLNNTNTGMNGAGANGLRGGRVQSRVLGRRQSRGDGAHEDGDGGTGTPPRTHSAMDASTDRGQDLLGSGVAASSAFLGTTQQESPQRRGKTSNPTRGGGGKKPSSGNSGGNDSKRGSDSGLDDEMDAAAYSALHPSGPGWYTASFFNIDGGGASATNLNRSANGGVTAQGRPRANSGSAAVTISPSTASAVGLGNSAPNLAPSMGYPQRQRPALTVNAQDQQTRVSRSSTVSAKSASFASPPQQPTSNLSAVANQTVNLSSTNSSADFYAGVRASLGSMTDRTLAPGNNGATSGRRGMADYDFMLDEGLEASVARPGARRAQPKGGDHTAGTSRARAEEPMFSSLGPGFAPGEYDMGSGLNIQSTALNRGQNRSEGVTYGTGTGGMGFHHTSDHSVQWSPAQQQQEQHAPRARIQPLEPMSNNFFSALNLRTLPAQSGLGTAPSGGHVVGGKGPQPDAGPSASGILAKDYISPAAYQLDLGMKAPSSTSGGNQGSSAQSPYGQPTAGAPPSLAQPTHVLEDEDDEWDLDLMPPDESAQQVLGIGSPTGRSSQANMSNIRTGKKRSLGEMGSSQSMLALMEQVAMGASPDVDTLNSSARPKQRKAAPRGQEGTVGADPDFPAIDDAHLRQQFRSVQATYGGVQDAITDILTELTNSTHDAARSDQLRSLLSYFTSLQYSLAHTN